MQIGKNKNPRLFLVLIIVLLSAVSCLRLQENHYNEFRIHHLEQNLHHLFSHDPSNEDHFTQIPQKVFSDLKDFVSNDTLITNRIHAEKPLSKESADKVKSYFLENQDFRDFTIKNLISTSKNPNCLDGIKQKSRDKLFKIILDQLDFSTIFMSQKPEQEFTQDQVNAIVLQLKTDKQLRPYLEKCFGNQKSVLR